MVMMLPLLLGDLLMCLARAAREIGGATVSPQGPPWAILLFSLLEVLCVKYQHNCASRLFLGVCTWMNVMCT